MKGKLWGRQIVNFRCCQKVGEEDKEEQEARSENAHGLHTYDWKATTQQGGPPERKNRKVLNIMWGGGCGVQTVKEVENMYERENLQFSG